jgi:hypothetical protein
MPDPSLENVKLIEATVVALTATVPVVEVAAANGTVKAIALSARTTRCKRLMRFALRDTNFPFVGLSTA